MTIITTCKSCGLQSYADGPARHMIDCKELLPKTIAQRAPTESELRALSAVIVEMVSTASMRVDQSVIAINGETSAYLNGDFDLLTVVRAVIRSLRDPTDDMLKAAFDAS